MTPFTLSLAVAASLLLASPALADTAADQPHCHGTTHTRHNKKEIAARQGISNLWDYELDHYVPLCLGGPDTENNLQLQSWPKARLKDAEERQLCEEVCAGTITQENAIMELERLWPRE